MEKLKASIKFLGILLPVFTSIILAGGFYGMSVFQAFSIAMPFLVNSMGYIGASIFFVPFLSRNYGGFWQMIVVRAVIPTIASSIIMFVVPTIAVITIKSIYRSVMSEESMIALAFLNVTAFSVLAVVRAVYEVKHSPSQEFSISVPDVIIVLSLLASSIATTPIFLRYGDLVTTGFSVSGYSITLAFLIRYILSAIPSAMFAVPYFTVLLSDRIRLR